MTQSKAIVSSMIGALMCGTAPMAAQAATQNFDFVFSYQTDDAPTVTNELRIQLSFDDSIAGNCSVFPLGPFTFEDCSYQSQSASFEYLAGPAAGDVISTNFPVRLLASSAKETASGDVVPTLVNYSLGFGGISSDDLGLVLDSLRLTFVPTDTENFDPSVFPAIDVAEFVSGRGYGIGGFPNATINPSLTPYDPPTQVPLPASGALLAMAAGGLALRSAAKAKRAAKRAARVL